MRNSAIAVALIVGSTTAARADELDEARPPLSTARLGGELLAGSFIGFGGGVGLGAAGGGIDILVHPCTGQFCNAGGALFGGELGLMLSAPIGVYLAGSHGDQTGSFKATMIGGMAGGAAGVLAIAASGDNDHLLHAGIALTLGGPVIGSMIGFNLTRRYKPGRTPSRTLRVAPTVGPTSFGFAGTF